MQPAEPLLRQAQPNGLMRLLAVLAQGIGEHTICVNSESAEINLLSSRERIQDLNLC